MDDYEKIMNEYINDPEFRREYEKLVECPLCDAVGTVRIQDFTGRCYTDGVVVKYLKRECKCAACGDRFTPSWMMGGNLARARAEIEKVRNHGKVE